MSKNTNSTKSPKLKIFELWKDGNDVLLISENNSTIKEYFGQFGKHVAFITKFEAEDWEQAMEMKKKYLEFNKN